MEKLIGLKKQLQNSRPGWWVSHPGAQGLRYHLELLAVLLRHKGGTAYGLLESGGSYLQFLEQKLLLTLTTKLISYYLN